MPGLNQLKEFSKELLSLGNEQSIRKQRGEIIPKINLPRTANRDDSDDFLLGILPNENDSLSAQNAQNTGDDNPNEDSISDDITNTIDYDALASDLFNSQNDSETDVENLLSNVYAKDNPADTMDFSRDDLANLLNEEEQTEIPSIIADDSDLSANDDSQTQQEPAQAFSPNDIEIPIPVLENSQAQVNQDDDDLENLIFGDNASPINLSGLPEFSSDAIPSLENEEQTVENPQEENLDTDPENENPEQSVAEQDIVEQELVQDEETPSPDFGFSDLADETEQEKTIESTDIAAEEQTVENPQEENSGADIENKDTEQGIEPQDISEQENISQDEETTSPDFGFSDLADEAEQEKTIENSADEEQTVENPQEKNLDTDIENENPEQTIAEQDIVKQELVQDEETPSPDFGFSDLADEAEQEKTIESTDIAAEEKTIENPQEENLDTDIENENPEQSVAEQELVQDEETPSPDFGFSDLADETEQEKTIES
ncbi:MAG: periplasmic-type flagellar collar protein FlcA, partial [Treponemataceae bacterium]